MTGKDPKKFDPARAQVLDAPERERYLPTDALVVLLDLQGDETVVDYGAGTGRLTIPVAHGPHGLGHADAALDLPHHFALLATPTT